MFRYKVVESSASSLNSKSYGILAEKENEDGWSTIVFLTNVSYDRDLVLCLADKSTKFQLKPSLLLDVILDIRY